MEHIHRTPGEIQKELARKIKQLRLSQNITQKDITRRTRISKHSIQNLEDTGKASITTLVCVLKVLGTDCSQLIPMSTFSEVDPIAIFNNSRPRQRARKRVR